MGRVDLKDRIREGVFLLDGAMGTELIGRGAEAGTCNDYLNISSSDIVADVHRAYLEAGSDAVITNTFGANSYALGRHVYSDKVRQINEAGVKIARAAAGEDKYVLGDIGPSGDFLEPLGGLKADELKEAFAEQAEGLLAGGVDGFIIETMTALDELAVAVEAIRSVCDLSVLASMSFDAGDAGFRTMMGVDVEMAVSKLASVGADAVGFNCGTASLDEYVELAAEYVSATKASGGDMAVFAEPNAGRPELVGDRVVYKVSPEDFAAAVERIHSGGVNIVGGCCGTSPAHIRAVAEKLKQ